MQTPVQTLNVELAERRYPIHIGQSLLQRADLILPHLARKQVAVISNTTVAPLYLEKFCQPLRDAGVTVVTVVLPDGEQYKTSETLNIIYDALLTNRCERNTTLIALGGGVIGDLVGFAAATFLRGVPFIQVPTTLLAQVDSSVGGKTGINHPQGKNMIGAFWQPKVVIADIETLNTLPERELSAGLAEVIKYGLIRDTVLAAQMSQKLGWISLADVARTSTLLQAANLPVIAPKLGIDTYLDLMGLDKKVKDGKIRLILLQGIGKAIFTSDYPAETLRATLAAVHE